MLSEENMQRLLSSLLPGCTLLDSSRGSSAVRKTYQSVTHTGLIFGFLFTFGKQEGKKPLQPPMHFTCSRRNTPYKLFQKEKTKKEHVAWPKRKGIKQKKCLATNYLKTTGKMSSIKECSDVRNYLSLSCVQYKINHVMTYFSSCVLGIFQSGI